MRKILMCTLFVIGLVAVAGASAAGGNISIEWFGQSCFLVTTSTGTSILTDPVVFKGYRIPEGTAADIVTVSHEAPDHNGLKAVSGHPVVLRGCDRGNREVVEIDETIKGVRIYTVPSFHDPGEHGENAIFVFEFDGIRLAHLGDIGTILTDAQIEAVGRIDILMIPVGGQFTIAGADADKVIDQLAVKSIVLPMHYKTKAFDDLPYSIDSYLEEKQNVRRVAGNTLVFDSSDMPSEREYVVLNYR